MDLHTASVFTSHPTQVWPTATRVDRSSFLRAFWAIARPTRSDKNTFSGARSPRTTMTLILRTIFASSTMSIRSFHCTFLLSTETTILLSDLDQKNGRDCKCHVVPCTPLKHPFAEKLSSLLASLSHPRMRKTGENVLYLCD